MESPTPVRSQVGNRWPLAETHGVAYTCTEPGRQSLATWETHGVAYTCTEPGRQSLATRGKHMESPTPVRSQVGNRWPLGETHGVAYTCTEPGRQSLATLETPGVAYTCTEPGRQSLATRGKHMESPTPVRSQVGNRWPLGGNTWSRLHLYGAR